MIDFIIAYYALGWVANAVEFVTEGYSNKAPFLACMVLSPVSLLANGIIWIGKTPICNCKPQYFWRKP